MPARILLVEDDAIIVGALSELLHDVGYQVEDAATEEAAIALACAAEPRVDLVLLDVTLARGSGFAVCRAVKTARPDLPVIFLTASDDEVSTVEGLRMGADDYVAKPFRPRELLARVTAALRRSQPARRVVRLGPLCIDTDRAHVERGDREVPLSALEYRLLLVFATSAGRLVTREQIRDALWDTGGAYVEDNTLTVYIKRLRGKIEDDPVHPQLIQTVRGLGYRSPVSRGGEA